MKAAVVTDFGKPPTYGDFREPVAGEGETIVRVHAAPLSPIVKALASGRHYTSGSQAGFVPGVDGVGTDPEGRRVYFLFPKAPFGSMGELTLVSNEMTVAIPDDISLRRSRPAAWPPGSPLHAERRSSPALPCSSTARPALPVAGGAGRAAPRRGQDYRGRSQPRALDRLEVEARIALDDVADGALRAEFDHGVDVVLDFIWGEPASRVIAAATKNRGSRMGEPRVRYVQLGTVAGDEISLRGDASAVRGSN